MSKDKEILLKILSRVQNVEPKLKKKKQQPKLISSITIDTIVETIQEYIAESLVDKNANKYQKAKSSHKIAAYNDCIKLLKEVLDN